MRWTPLTIRIANFVAEAHAGQKDKIGAPYIFHLMDVAYSAETEDGTCVALLHDWAEDVVPDWPPEKVSAKLSALGVSDKAIEAILLLRHRPNEPYSAYIGRLQHNKLAREVKYYDLCSNSDPDRLALLEEGTRERLQKKYHLASETLLQWRSQCAGSTTGNRRRR